MRQRVGQQHLGATQSETLDEVYDPQSGHQNVNITLGWRIASGIALGAAYAASPVTCLFLALTAGMFVWAGRGLSNTERWWVWRLLALAVTLRLIAVAVLLVTSDSRHLSTFPWEADGENVVLRSWAMRNIWLGIPITPIFFNYAFNPVYGWTTFLYPLAYVHYIFGPAPYGVHVINVGLSVATAVMLHRLTRSAYGPGPALLGLALLLFLPTLFMWSVSVLKEPPFVFLAALALVAVVRLLRGRLFRARAIALGVLVAALATIDGVRAGGRLLAVVGLAVGVAGSLTIRRTVLAILVPVLVAAAATQAMRDPAIQRRIMAQLERGAGYHIGHVNTSGEHYKLLDQRFYERRFRMEGSMTAAEGARFAVRALVSVVVFPLPWQMNSATMLTFLPQQLLWYVIVALAVVGFVAGLRRDALVTCLLAGVAAVGAAGVGLNSGNFGTMVRHRDMIVPFVVWLSALGGVVMVSRLLPKGERWR
jgi:hypothetical protein